MSRSRPSWLTLSKQSPFFKALLASGALLLALNGALAWWLEQRSSASEERAIAAAAERRAKSVATTLSEQLEQLHTVLTDAARREDLAEAVRAGDEGILEPLKQDLYDQLEGLHAVHLFPADQVRGGIDETGPALRFAELDMMNRAEQREEVFPEAVRTDDEWRLSLVQPIPLAQEQDDAAPVSALLLASVAAQDYLKPARELTPDQGTVQVLQQYPGQAAQAVLGPQLNPNDAAEAAVAGSYLRVRFVPSQALIGVQRVSRTPNYLVLGLTSILSVALAWWLANLAARRFGTRDEEQPREMEVDDLLSLEVTKEDSDLLGLSGFRPKPKPDPLDIREPARPGEIPGEVFRSYDIRGRVPDQLGPEQVVLIGRALGSATLAAGDSIMVVARDGRTHGSEVTEQLVKGILATGCDVINIGLVPTPVLYFACQELQNTSSGVMVTASHNPAEYNGFKMVVAGKTLKDEDIKRLQARIEAADFEQGAGKESFSDLSLQYIDRIFADIALAGEISLVVDAGNGAAGKIAPRLFEELGCTVTPLFCEIDGTFPNHPPDPSVPENLRALQDKVKETGADLGVALDGDGDRVCVVTGSGQIVSSDRLLMVLAKDLVARNPGADVVFDVKCSRELNRVISAYGGRPIMWKAGHSHIKAKMEETGALLGGELSGHIFIKERWYGFDDGLYAAARLLEIISLRDEGLDSILENFPVPPATPEIRIQVPEQEKFALIQRLTLRGDFGSGRLSTIDGIRVDYPEGWGLVRASNTAAELTLRFEGENADALKTVADRFREQLLKVDPQLSFEL
ncbi:phosphomannomutase/phosphoglucomutase [Gilvimarinus sp. F26214L]|uniref:phosphomannomutase/phosphoglucomutase n=1 Tax=Gilvimarinus sp. DZF01 TaxID=3461371 RepID=UPI0040464F54